MKNVLAAKLAEAAKSYKSRNPEDPEVQRVVQIDYEDLMTIACMIEDGTDKKTVARAMWNLDTAVRDEIPDDVYYAYNR